MVVDGDQFSPWSRGSLHAAQYLPVEAPYLLSAGLFALALLLVWWRRERSVSNHKRVLRGLVSISEDVLGAATAREVADRIRRSLPGLLPAAQAEIYLLDRNDDYLVRVSGEPGDAAVPVGAPSGTLEGAVALCYRNRTTIRIPDTRNTPLLEPDGPDLPASALLLPMFAQKELAGILLLCSRREETTWPDYEVMLQHMANQAAIALRLQEQKQLREQVLRTEKLAAAGQLISAIADELRAPLETVRDHARFPQVSAEDLQRIESAAERGLNIIGHLVSFSRLEQRNSEPLDAHELLGRVLDARASARERKGLQCGKEVPPEPALITGDRDQLESALLTVIVQAEYMAAASPERRIDVSSHRTGKKISLQFACPHGRFFDGQDPVPSKTDYFGLPVAQVIVQSHGGDLRPETDSHGHPRFVLELPVTDNAPEAPELVAPPAHPTRVLTCLLVEPDFAAQRRLLSMLASRGHRAVPVNGAEEGAELAQRMQFAAVLCSARVSGLTWTEFHHRVRRRTGAFGLLAETWDATTAQAAADAQVQLLATPVAEDALDSFLALAEVRLAAGRP